MGNGVRMSRFIRTLQIWLVRVLVVLMVFQAWPAWVIRDASANTLPVRFVQVVPGDQELWFLDTEGFVWERKYTSSDLLLVEGLPRVKKIMDNGNYFVLQNGQMMSRIHTSDGSMSKSFEIIEGMGEVRQIVRDQNVTIWVEASGKVWYQNRLIFAKDGRAVFNSTAPEELPGVVNVRSATVAGKRLFTVLQDGSLWVMEATNEPISHFLAPPYRYASLQRNGTYDSVYASGKNVFLLTKDRNVFLFRPDQISGLMTSVDLQGIPGVNQIDEIVTVPTGWMARTKDGRVYVGGDDQWIDPTVTVIPPAEGHWISEWEDVLQAETGENWFTVLREDQSIWGWGASSNRIKKAFPIRMSQTMLNRWQSKRLEKPVATVEPIVENNLQTEDSIRVVFTPEPTEVPSWNQPTPSLRPLPTFPPDANRVKQIMMRDDAFFVLTENGELWSWGSNSKGQLGRVSQLIDPIPRLVTGLKSIRSISKTDDRYLVLDERGNVWAWGLHSRRLQTNGQSIESHLIRYIPYRVTGLPQVQTLLSCYEEPTARATDGSIWTWGRATHRDAIPSYENYAIDPVKVDQQHESRKLACNEPATDRTYHNEQAQSTFSEWASGSNIPFPVDRIRMFTHSAYKGLVVLADQSLWEMEKQNGLVQFQKIHLQGTWLSSVLRDPWSEQKPRIQNVSGWNETILMVDEKGYAWQREIANRSLSFRGAINWNQGATQKPRLIPTLRNVKSFSPLGKYALLKDGTVMVLDRNNMTGNTLAYSQYNGIDQVKQISETEYGVLFLRKDGTVWAAGEIVNPPNRSYAWSRTVPEQLPGLNDIVQVSFSNARMVALKSNGTLWTMEPSEKANNGSSISNFFAAPLERASGIKQVRYLHLDLYVIKADGSLWRLDVPEPGQKRDPAKDRRVPHVPTFDEIDVYRGQVIARNDQGDVYVSGLNETFSSYSSNMEINDRRLFHFDGKVSDVAAIRNHYLFVKDGMVWGMGANITKEPVPLFEPMRTLIGIDNDSNDPFIDSATNERQQFFLTRSGMIVEVDPMFKVTKQVLPNRAQAIQITAGKGYSAALDRQGSVYRWGRGLMKQNQTISDADLKPSPIKELPQMTFIQAASDRLYLIDRSNQLWAYDSNGITKLEHVPPIRDFATNGIYAMAIAAKDNRLYSWILQDPSSPQVLGEIDQPTKIAVTKTHYYAMDSNGRMYKWDMNRKSFITHKEVDGLQIERTIETNVKGLKRAPTSDLLQFTDVSNEPIGNIQFASFEAGTDHLLLLAKDGSLWAEGNNDYGQCGGERSIPLATMVCQLDQLGPVSVFSAGSNRSSAVLVDGSVWMWGEGISFSNHMIARSEILPPISSPESTKKPIETPTVTPKTTMTPAVSSTPFITPKPTTRPTLTPTNQPKRSDPKETIASHRPLPTIGSSSIQISLSELPAPIPSSWVSLSEGIHLISESEIATEQKVSFSLMKRPNAAIQHLIIMRRWDDALGQWKTVPGQWNASTSQFDALISQTGQYAVMGRKITFSDVAYVADRTAIEAVTVRGLLSGYSNGQFKPDQAMSRAEFASIMTKAFELEPPVSKRSLIDVNKKHWAYIPIQNSIAAGWMKTSNGRFLPNAKLTREQAYVILARALHLQMTDIENAREALFTFEDGDLVSDFAVAPMVAIIDAGLLEPDLMSIRPKEMITRAEIATALYRMEAWRIAQYP